MRQILKRKCVKHKDILGDYVFEIAFFKLLLLFCSGPIIIIIIIGTLAREEITF